MSAAVSVFTPAQVRARNAMSDALPAAMPRLRRQFIVLCKDVGLAEDLVQEAVTKGLENADKFEEGTNLEAWLYTIGRNHFLSALRKKAREVEDVDGGIAGNEGREASQDYATRLRELMEAINKLPNHMRQAVRLVCIMGESYEQAAQKCGCDVGTIKSRVSRARLLLGDHGQTPAAEKSERESVDPRPIGGNDQSFLYALAKKYVNDHEGDPSKASSALCERLLSDRMALEEVVGAAVREAIRQYTGKIIRHRRQQISERAQSGRGAVVALAAGISAALLDMPLTGGVKLRQASRSLVIEEADRLDVRAREAGRRAKWLRLIAQSIPNGKSVGDVMDDTRAQELWNECKS